MEVILREDIDNLGTRGDVVKVAPGYARNFLLPKRLAVEATESNADAELRDAALGSIRRLKALEPSIAYFSHDARVYRRGGRGHA